MTWLKLSDDFVDDCAAVDLSDAAFRTHVQGLSWSNRRLTNGQISALALRRLADTRDPNVAVQELVNVGFWVKVEDGWQIVHHMEHQPSREEVETKRREAAERQRKSRSKRKDAKSGVLPITADVTRDNTRDPGRDGTGLVGSGLARRQLEGIVEHLALPSADNFEVGDTCQAPGCTKRIVRTGEAIVFPGRQKYCDVHQKIEA
jgi:hypothetical protein